MRALRALAIAAAVGAAGAVFALAIPDRPAGRVSDWAGKLSAPARERVEAALAGHERATGAQVAVAIFPGLDGQDTDDFTNRLFERWKLGRAGVDDGVLLAVFVAERRARIEVGYGLEDKLTDALSRRILETELFPRLRAGDWDGAIEGSATAMIAVARGEVPPSLARDVRRKGSAGVPIFAAVVAILALMFILSRLSASSVITRRGRRRLLRGGDIFWGGGPWSGGGGSWGGGGSRSWGGGGGGGGFSGGGGMSGGGGASGSW